MRSPFLDRLLRAPGPEEERKASTMEADEKYVGVGMIAVHTLIGLVLILTFRHGLSAQLTFAGICLLALLCTVLAARIGNRYVMLAAVLIAAFMTVAFHLPPVDIPSGQPADQFKIYGVSATLLAIVPSYVFMFWLVTRINKITRAKMEAERAAREERRKADKATASGKARQSGTGRKPATASSRYTPPSTPSKTRQRKMEARRARQHPTPRREDEPAAGGRRRPFGLGRKDAEVEK